MIQCINNQKPTCNYKSSYNISFRAKPIPNEIAQNLKTKLFSAKSWDIYCHRAADYDTTKAAMVMADLARKMHIKAYLCIDPKDIRDLSLHTKKYKIKDPNSKPSELALILDHNGFDKLSEKFKKLLEQTKEKLIIDHHLPTENTFKDAYKYIDETARACCAVIYRFLEALEEDLRRFAKNLAMGIYDDYGKSKYIKFKKSGLEKLNALKADKNANEVLERVEKKLKLDDKKKIYKHLDVLSNLKPKEIEFREEIFKNIKVTTNGKLAYVIIDPENKKWKRIGMDNTRTSAILRDLRLRLINGAKDDKIFTAKQRKKFGNLEGAVVFYPIINENQKIYQLSMHSKDGSGYTLNCLNHAKEAYIEKYSGRPQHEFFKGGHSDRGGGRIFSNDKTEIENMVNSVLEAAQKLTDVEAAKTA